MRFVPAVPDWSVDRDHPEVGRIYRGDRFRVIKGVDVVKKNESLGSQSGEPRARIVIANCGRLSLGRAGCVPGRAEQSCSLRARRLSRRSHHRGY